MKSLALIMMTATPGHFWKARQELASAQTACRAFQKRPGVAWLFPKDGLTQ
jgi:hypothetical protein